MGIASEMKELTCNIASSHEDRMRRIGEIKEEAKETREETQSIIMGFGALRHETGRQLRRDLAHDKANIKSQARDILSEAQDILKGFEAYRQDTNAQLRDDLSRATTVIRSEAQEIQAEAQNLIKGYRISRQKLCSKLTKELRRSRVKAKSEVEKLLGNAQSLVNNFQTSRREAGSQLKRDLAQSRANMESDVKQMQSDFRKTRRAIRAALKEARVAWQDLVRGKTLPKARVTDETPNYRTRLLAVVNEHPEGITLGDMADTLGVVPVVLARASKTLVDKGTIRKENRLYFPAASE
jgi:uncharacterized protein YicC (UPF0701 family)